MGISSDTYLNVGTSNTTVALTADNQAVTVGSFGVIELTSDNTTAANRTFTLSTPAASGQRLTLIFTSAASSTAQLADSGTCSLSAAWEPLVGDTLSLVALGSTWYEVARADN